jgi:bifunctional DNA-binding transcriptional regulator/antitoxin component of YhaV-PrlF toxin-antitoxin module
MSTLSFAINVARNGRMVLPAPARDALAIQGETRIFLIVENGEARIETTAQRIARARDMYRQFAKTPRDVDTFLAERERDA